MKNKDTGALVNISENNIAWESDRLYKFKNMPADNPTKLPWNQIQWTDMENGKTSSIIYTYLSIEHFIVWMRTAGLPNFRKLWGRIDETLAPGNYTVEIQNKYDVNGFDGNKSFVLSTTNALGGKNYFLAICYLVVGSLCLVFAIIFLVAFLKKKNARTD